MFAFLRTARKSVTAVLAGLSLLGLAACQTGVGGGGPSINTSKPVPVALLLPYGSGQETDVAVARALENAARLAVADLGDVKIDLRVYNTAANPETASNVTVKAINEGAKIIIGPLYAEAANAAGLAAAGRGVNVLAFSNNTEIAGGNVFLLGSTFANTARRLVRYAAGQGKKKILVVHANTPAGELGKQAIESAVRGSSASLAASVGYNFSQQEIINALPTVASTARETAADSIFLTADVASDLPLLAQLLPENGATPDKYQYMGLTRWDGRPQLHALAAIQGGWFTMPDTARYSKFQSRFESAYGARPHPLAGLAYDGIAAIGALAGTGSSDALTTSRLTQGSGFSGVYGAFRLRPDGTNERALAVATITDSKVQILDPAPQSFGGTGF
ncbi:MAG: penicillin-binding protein activator [Brevirhabdus sp.]